MTCRIDAGDWRRSYAMAKLRIPSAGWLLRAGIAALMSLMAADAVRTQGPAYCQEMDTWEVTQATQYDPRVTEDTIPLVKDRGTTLRVYLSPTCAGMQADGRLEIDIPGCAEGSTWPPYPGCTFQMKSDNGPIGLDSDASSASITGCTFQMKSDNGPIAVPATVNRMNEDDTLNFTFLSHRILFPGGETVRLILDDGEGGQGMTQVVNMSFASCPIPDIVGVTRKAHVPGPADDADRPDQAG
jgi:hypothetical protein